MSMSAPLSLPARGARRARPDALPVEVESWPLSDAPWRGVQWSPTYVAFLWYIAVITTYRVPGAAVAMAVGLISMFASRDRLRFPTLLGWLAMFIAWAAVAYPVTRFPEVVQERLTDLTKVWLIALVAANVLRTRAQIRFFVIFFLACFALYPLRGALFNYYFAGYSLAGRALWNFIFANPNDLAAFALLQLSMVVGLLVTERRKSWVWLAALIGVVLLPLLILMTQSRGGFTALIVFVILLLGHRRRRPLVLFAAAGLAVSLALIAPTGVWTRVSGLQKATNTENLEEVDPEGSAKQRFEIWKVAVKVIGDQPVLGVGAGAYSLAHASYARDEGFDPIARGAIDTHSTVLNVFAETGAPGLLLFLGLLLSIMWKAERIRRACRTRLPRASTQLLYLEFGLAAFLVAGVFASLAYLAFLYIHLVLIWAAAEACRHDVVVGRRTAVRGPTAGPPWSFGERLRRNANAIDVR
jgi:probable O-glycosylation ligase (exosortase A-associated)